MTQPRLALIALLAAVVASHAIGNRYVSTSHAANH